MKSFDDELGAAGVFGRPFATALDAPVLVIGRDAWNRLDLAAMGITQLRAARIVSTLARELRARSVRDMYKRLAPGDLARHPGAGLHTLYVLWRVFDAAALNAGAWYWRGRAGAIRTFTTLKAREHRAQAAERAGRRRPARAIRPQREVA